MIAVHRDARRRPPPPFGRSPPSRHVAPAPCADGAVGRRDRQSCAVAHGAVPRGGVPRGVSLCGSCWRGQAYCGAICRETAQRLQGRRAAAKYQRSPEGRLDHCDRQRVYRAKCRLRVTHAPSPRPPRSTTIAPPVRHAGIRARVPHVWARVGETSGLALATRAIGRGTTTKGTRRWPCVTSRRPTGSRGSSYQSQGLALSKQFTKGSA